MIHRLNEQVLDSADSAASPRDRKQEVAQRRNPGADVATSIALKSDRLSPATSTLRNLVEENEKNAAEPSAPAASPEGGTVSEEANNGEDGDDDDSDMDEPVESRAAKRTKVQ